MVAAHFHVELADCAVEGDISVLFVHVVDAGSGLVSEHNSESLNMVGPAFEDLVDGEDLTLGTLSLQLSSEVVPELGFGNHIVASEESNSIDFGVGVSLSGELAAHHQKLSGFHLQR